MFGKHTSFDNPIFELNKRYLFQTPNTNTQNRAIINENKITSNMDYREYIQKNAVSIMRHEIANEPNNRHVPINIATFPTSDIKTAYMNRTNFTATIVCPEVHY